MHQNDLSDRLRPANPQGDNGTLLGLQYKWKIDFDTQNTAVARLFNNHKIIRNKSFP